MNDNLVMQEMIANHESCRIERDNGCVYIKLRPKSIEENLNDKLSSEDISTTSQIMARRRKNAILKNELRSGCLNVNCCNRDKCMASIPNGSIASKIMVINKMPTDYETAVADCFCDTDGAFFTFVLSKMNINRDDIYCTDMIKCNTQLNEYSFNECVKTYLEREIEIVSPRVIICNGLSTLKACIRTNIFCGLNEQPTYGNMYDVTLPNGHVTKVIAMYDLDTVLKKDKEGYEKCKNELWCQMVQAFKTAYN